MARVVPLTKGYQAVVDDGDFALISAYSWHAKSGKLGVWYAAARGTNGTPRRGHILMHRLILGVADERLVDHIDGNGLNNTRANLRACNARQNAENKANLAARKRAAGTFLGVSFVKAAGLWTANIHAGRLCRNGERARISLKCHASAEEAARIYDSAARHYFGAFAGLNFPNEEPAPFIPGKVRGTSLLSAAQKSAISRDNISKIDRRGSAHGMSKLSEESVREIRNSEARSALLAHKYQVSAKTIRDVRARRAWLHVA